MLVLSRKIGESIVIGDNIHVTVNRIQGDKVVLGFDAPKEIAIHRSEVYGRIQDERRLLDSRKPQLPGGTNATVSELRSNSKEG